MALHLGARSLTLGRLLQQGCRPAAIAVFGGANEQHLAPRDESLVEGYLQQRNVENEAPSSFPYGICGNGFGPPASGFGAQLRTLGTVAAAEANVATEASGTEAKEEREIPQERPRGKTAGPAKRRGKISFSQAVRSRHDLRWKLYRGLRQLPPDVDLDEKYPDKTIDGKAIETRAVRQVLYQLAKGPTKHMLDLEANIEGGGEEEPLIAPLAEGQVYQCSENDAKRALNAFEWWAKGDLEKGFNGTAGALIDPVLQALGAAGLYDEILRLWDRYRGVPHNNSSIVSYFLAACQHSGMHESVLALHADAEANDWPMRPKAGDMVVRAMRSLNRPRDEVWGFYKRMVEKTGVELHGRPAFVALIESGVTIDEIRSLEYKEPMRLANRLVQALSTLGRKDEAYAIVREILEDTKELPTLGLLSFVGLLRTLIHSGFVEEAQTLADQQGKLGLRLDGAVSYVLQTSDTVQTGLETYRTLQILEGPHKRSRSVQSLLIKNCYGRLNQTDKMYEAYLAARDFKGHFYADTFADLIRRLAFGNRVAEAEGVLADYYQARRELQEVAVLPEKPFEQLAAIYLKAKEPHKLVTLVKDMVTNNYFVNSGLIEFWAKQLEEGNHHAEAEEVRVAKAKINEIRQKWIGNVKSRGEWVEGGRPKKPVKGKKESGNTEGGQEEAVKKGGEDQNRVQEAERAEGSPSEEKMGEEVEAAPSEKLDGEQADEEVEAAPSEKLDGGKTDEEVKAAPSERLS